MIKTRITRWPRDSNKSASGKPGAVHREALALRAAATLLREAPDRLWRRCACIAAENVGLASLETMGIVTAALAGKKFRADRGGEWRIACCIISELCRAAQSGDREQPFHGIVSAHST
jgi:replication-associated recombination protein RarA